MIERWLGACLTVIALVWLWLAQVFIPDIRTEGEPGPRGFPVLLGVVLAVLGISLFVRSMIRTYAARKRAGAGRGDGAMGNPEARDQAIAPVTRREASFVGATFALLILYAFLLDKVGFTIGTPIVMVLALSTILRIRRWPTVVAFAVGFTFVCWLIFAALLATPLPRGTWIAWL